MKNQDIYDLMDRFEATGIARLKLSMGDTVLELEKGIAASVAPTPAVEPATGAAAPATQPVATEPAAVEEDLPSITAPLVGTFYVAAKPGEDPYVQPGDRVKRGDVVGLLEAMKMMSEVCAPCDCVIERVLAQDGELVSFGAPLIRYREA